MECSEHGLINSQLFWAAIKGIRSATNSERSRLKNA